MKKIFLILLMIFSFIYSIFPDVLTADQAMCVGKFFLYNQQQLMNQKIEQRKFMIEYKDYQTSEMFYIFNDNDRIIVYLIKLEPEGFIAVSSDTNLEPIIAYSFQGCLRKEIERSSIFIQFLKSDMEMRLRAMPHVEDRIIKKNKSLWEIYLNWDQDFNHVFSQTIQWPPGRSTGWLDTTWEQMKFYNDSCPDDPISADPCPTGSTAAAMGQIIFYWKYPLSVEFNDDDNYFSRYDPQDGRGERRIFLDVVPDNVKNNENEYEYDLKTPMASLIYPVFSTPLSSDYKQFVADLNFACGVSIETGYSDKFSVGSTKNAKKAFKKKWKYFSSVLKKSSKSDFYKKLQNNMKDAKPALLEINIKEKSDVYTVVVDGYRKNDKTDEYHLNFGMGKNAPDDIKSAWYSLPEGMPLGYNVIEKGVLNISPYKDPYENNNTRDLAFFIGFEEYIEKWIGKRGTEINPSSDQDWFKFESFQGDELTIKCDVTSKLDAVISVFYENSLLKRENSTGSKGDESVRLICPSEGTYYIKISNSVETPAARGVKAETGSYKLNIKRIGLMLENPEIESFRINNGKNETYSRTITLDNICTGEPEFCMASENKNFKDAEWKSYSESPQFNLSSTFGEKTVYLKVKNSFGESKSKKDTIVLEENTVTETYEFVSKWGQFGFFNGSFIIPSGIAADRLGNIYVVDTMNHRIQKFTSDGEFILKWGSKGSGNSQFDYPAGIAVDSQGNVYVSDGKNCCIQKFTSDGIFLKKWGEEGKGKGQFLRPLFLAIDDNNGNVYVSDNIANCIQIFTSDGDFVEKWSLANHVDWQFYAPTGINIDGSGNVYVAEFENCRIRKFSSNGKLLDIWRVEVPEDAPDMGPAGIALSEDGAIFIVAYDESDKYCWVRKYSIDGRLLAELGERGNSDGEFNVPLGVALNPSGFVYVTDGVKNNVQKFRRKEE